MQELLRHPYRFVAITLALEAIAAVFAHGSGIAGLQAAARYSGRAGLFWFALVFAIAPWHRFAPSATTRLALSRRRHLGLAFGMHHFVHLAVLLTYLGASGKGLDPGRAAGGMLGYVFLAAMMLTSTDAAVRRLGPRNWKRLHRTGLWYLWVVFLVTYASRLQGTVPEAGGGTAEFVTCVTLAISLGAFRLAAFAASRRRVDSRETVAR